MTIWTLLLAAFLVLRIDVGTQENSMDERIVLAVSRGMSESSRLDPNWIYASPHYYRYPQYNFYSFNLLSHFWIMLASPLRVEPVVVLRIMNVLYQVGALGLVILTLRKIGIPQTGLVAAAALLTFTPGMVHDAHIARCESFLYLLFAGAMYTAVAERFLIGGLILGVGAAAKVTFLASGLLFIPALFAIKNSYSALLRRAATIGAATVVGFAASAPYAVINFPVLVAGLARIRGIYLADGPGPHRLLDPTPVKNAFHAVAFFTVISGSLVLSGFIAPLFNRAAVFLGVWMSSV
ncbi:glycosyltransferase 87 family protein, partial [uncultured Bradyrhizobium sp.]|uniref:glycosyltransferase 87 family protein n=1 Tax=uncultured Bradyrhizobium sp. TaxID=199684 RepID=UPI0035CB0A9D